MTIQKIRLAILQEVDGLLVGQPTNKQIDILDNLIVDLETRLEEIIEADKEESRKLRRVLGLPAEPVVPDKSPAKRGTN